MKQKIHMPCHPDAGGISLSNRYIFSLTYWFIIFFVLSTNAIHSQNTDYPNPDYDWVWATSGGGHKNMGDNDSSWKDYYLNREINFEQVVDVKVDADNNSYILAIIGQMDTEFAGQPVEVYNNTDFPYNVPSDIFLASLDCEGQVRWVRVIGGGASDYAYSLGLDDNGGVYIGAKVTNYSDPNRFGGRLYVQPHFDENTYLPYLEGVDPTIPHEGYKSLALAKYNTADGSLDWVQFPEGLIADRRTDRTGHLGAPLTYLSPGANKIITEADGTTHWLVVFREGVHLDGAITVSETPPYYDYHEFWVLVYNADGTVKRYFKVPLTTNDNISWTVDNPDFDKVGQIIVHQDDHNFWYDSVKQQYYLGGSWGGIYNSFPNASFNGTPFTDGGYIVAFDTNGNELWRTTSDENVNTTTVLDVKTDTEGSVYITGFIATKGVNDGSGAHYDGYFGNYKITGTAGTPYIMKLSPDNGKVVWGTFGTQKPTESGHTSNLSSKGERLTFTDREVILAMGLGPCKWGAFDSEIVYGEYYNPFLVRFNKEDGEPKGLYRINTGKTTPSKMMAVAVDNDGNFITGGFHSAPMFYDHPTMPLRYGVGGHVDFFVAKLAASECGTPVLETETPQSTKPVLFPNPTQGMVYWKSDIIWTYYEVYDISGKIVQRGALNRSEVNLSSLASGTYILALLDGNGNRVTEKIVKE